MILVTCLRIHRKNRSASIPNFKKAASGNVPLELPSLYPLSSTASIMNTATGETSNPVEQQAAT
jgi:hypothetical protein